MTSHRHIHLAVPSWMMRSQRLWTRWWRTRRLARQVRLLRKKVLRQERAIRLQLEFLQLLEKLEHPLLLVSPTPILEQLPPQLELPPPLTPEEIRELRALPMPDPLEEIEARLGLSTTPLSPATWSD